MVFVTIVPEVVQWDSKCLATTQTRGDCMKDFSSGLCEMDKNELTQMKDLRTLRQHQTYYL